MIRKIFVSALGFGLLATPLAASADQLSDLQAKLDSLLAQIATLQTQLGTLSTTNTTTDTQHTNVVALAPYTIGTSTSAGLLITGVRAPAQLRILQAGTWTVFATSATTTDPLIYTASWGDTSSATIQSSPTFTHTYTNVGTFSPQFSVTNASSSDVANATTTVTVLEDETAPPGVPTCPAITRRLSLGMTDGQTAGEVSDLQRFLVRYFSLNQSLITGAFGEQTEQYVKRFQSQKGIDNVGYTGPQTRTAIAVACAQLEDHQAPPPSPLRCVRLTYNLAAGMRDETTGGDVTRLQQFLGINATGFFGPSTEDALKRWQSDNGIVSSGRPDTTGFGYAGPRTRRAMRCEDTPSTMLVATPTLGAVPLTVNVTFPHEWRPLVATQCTNGNNPNFVGRTFSINWGDGTYPQQNGRNAPCATHTYTTSGRYTIRAEVYDFSDVNEFNGNFTRTIWTGTTVVTVSGMTTPVSNATGSLIVVGCAIPVGTSTCTIGTSWTSTNTPQGVRVTFTPQGGNEFNMYNNGSPASYTGGGGWWSAGTHTIKLYDSATNAVLDSESVVICGTSGNCSGAFPPALATYKAYSNDTLVSTINSIGRSDATLNCLIVALNNSAASVRCTWNNEEIYSRTVAPPLPQPAQPQNPWSSDSSFSGGEGGNF